jgi:hypothetical protein
MLAIGLDREFSERWSYSLPAGTYETEVQFVRPLRLPGGKLGWLFAGADGSIHIVSSDGSLRDSFGTGKSVTGLAAWDEPAGPVMLLASPDGLTAWRISRR